MEENGTITTTTRISTNVASTTNSKMVTSDSGTGTNDTIASNPTSSSTTTTTMPSSSVTAAGLTTTKTMTATATATTATTTTTDQYSVSVQAQYLLPNRSPILPSTTTIRSSSSSGDNNNNSNSTTTRTDHRNDNQQSNDRRNNNNNNNNRRGGKQNKKRPRDVKIQDDIKICRAILRGEPCPYENNSTTTDDTGNSNNHNHKNKNNNAMKCRYIHDTQMYLQTLRPPDIQPIPIENIIVNNTNTSTNNSNSSNSNNTTLPVASSNTTSTSTTLTTLDCPIYKLYQYCPYGIMCRFGLSSNHIDPITGQNIFDPNSKLQLFTTTNNNNNTTSNSSSSSSDSMVLPNVKNILSTELQTQLRKNTYPFQCQRRKFEQQNKQKQNQKQEQEQCRDSDDIPNDGNATVVATSTNTDPIPTITNDDDALIKKINVDGDSNRNDGVVDTYTENQNTLQSGESNTNNINNNNRTGSHIPYPTRTRKLIDFSNKVYIAPLTTVGNLPFRRIMKQYGADITCGEMAIATNILEGKASEWALIKRHTSEDIFGIQLAAGYPDIFTRTMELIEHEHIETDFVDLNLGCPIDLVCQKGAGAALMQREKRLHSAIEGILSTLHKCPITIKMRTGWDEKVPTAHDLINKIQNVWGYNPNNGVNAIMIHGRSRLQRYSREANWDYIGNIATSMASSDNDTPTIPIIGNGDIMSYVDYQEKVLNTPGIIPCAMLGRGALIKPWLPTEIKELRHYDISASERLDILRNFVNYGLEHWGTDQQGVNNCRRFLLEWLSFLHRYIPVGLLDHYGIPQRLNQRPPQNICGRNDLETLFMSNNCYDWIKISEMLLGPVPDNFHFEPKHKANSY